MQMPKRRGGFVLNMVNLWEDSKKPKAERVPKDFLYFVFFVFWPLAGAGLDVMLVDYLGGIAEGKLVRGDNPVLMTMELVLEVLGEDAR